MFIFFLPFQIISGLQLSYFTAPTFTDTQGWTNPFRNGTSIIGLFNSLSYAGFVKDHPGDISILIHNLPPHQYIRLRATMMINITDVKIENGIRKFDDSIGTGFYWFVDHSKLLDFELVRTYEYQSSKVDLLCPHNSYSAFIKFSMLSKKVNVGIRDVYIDFIECPVGCIKCKMEEEQSVCLQYKLLDFELNGKELYKFNNDGWYYKNPAKPFNIFLCDDVDLKVGLFGVNDKTDVLTKIVILPPHYYIQIELLVFYFNQRIVNSKYIKSLNLIYEIDGNQAESNNVGQSSFTNPICYYSAIDSKFKTNLESVERFQFYFSHSQRLMNITIQTQDLYENNVYWAIREFQIIYKACHSSCLQGCKGRTDKDCIQQNFQLTTLSYDFFDQSLPSTINFNGWITTVEYTDTSLCNNYQILGGFGVFNSINQQISYYYYNIPQHSTLTLQFILYQIDTFNLNDKFFVYLFDQKIYENTFAQLTDGVPLCGLLDQDKTYVINLNSIAHTASYAVFKFYSQQSATSTGYWGIRGIKLYQDSKFFLQQLLSKQSKGETVQSISMISTPPITKCLNGNYDFIGYFSQGQNFTKHFINIPAHPQLLITFKLIVAYHTINNNNFSNITKSISMAINKNVVWQKYFTMNSTNKACDTSDYSQIYKFQYFLNHTLSDAWVEIFSEFSGDQKWGVRDLKIELFDNTS